MSKNKAIQANDGDLVLISGPIYCIESIALADPRSDPAAFKCDTCDNRVLLTKQQQEVWKEHETSAVICWPCLLKLQGAVSSDILEVLDLRNDEKPLPPKKK